MLGFHQDDDDDEDVDHDNADGKDTINHDEREDGRWNEEASEHDEDQELPEHGEEEFDISSGKDDVDTHTSFCSAVQDHDVQQLLQKETSTTSAVCN
jgi:DNA phosphorothioation-dependent restriction protein DptG